jgi:hypothetical protein
MMDVEFAVQFLVLAHSAAHPQLLDNKGNIALLQRAEAAGLLPPGVGVAAADAYRELRRAQHRARLDEQPTQVAPETLALQRDAVSRSGGRCLAERERAWWIALAILLGGGALVGWSVPHEAIDWQPSLATASHGAPSAPRSCTTAPCISAANLAGAALVAALGTRRACRARRPRVARGLAAHAARPAAAAGAAHYGGCRRAARGVAIVGVHLLATARGRSGASARRSCVVLSRRCCRSAVGRAAAPSAGWDIAIAPLAHASGWWRVCVRCIAEATRAARLPSPS